MIRWQHFPKSEDATSLLKEVIKCFENVESRIASSSHRRSSSEVLKQVRPYLESLDFRVETGKRAEQKVRVPVLFGLDGKPEKSFEVDAYHEDSRTVLEIEAGRAVTNYQFLKDFFETCIMHNVDYLALAIRKTYRKRRDFKNVLTFFDTLYASGRVSIPLKGILVIGY